MTAAPVIGFGMPGYQEMIVILIVGLLIFGRRLPEVGRTLGKTVVQLRKGIADFKDQIREDSELRDVKATVHDFKKAVDAPRVLAQPGRLLDNLTDEALSTPGPEAEAADPKPADREAE